MMFRNREEAGRLLAEKLRFTAKEHPLVLGIPRGAVRMAQVIADRLDADLDVVLVHKVGAPDNPEFAIGSVSEFGSVYRSPVFDYYAIAPGYLEGAIQVEIDKLRKKRASYSPIRPPISPEGRTVIIVDDGLATGATMLAAIRAIREQKAKRIIVAAPVASQSAVELLEPETDQMIILDTPEDFYAISQFYDEFSQVSDEEVYDALENVAHKTRKRAA